MDATLVYLSQSAIAFAVSVDATLVYLPQSAIAFEVSVDAICDNSTPIDRSTMKLELLYKYSYDFCY